MNGGHGTRRLRRVFTIDTRLDWLNQRYAQGHITLAELAQETTRLLLIDQAREDAELAALEDTNGCAAASGRPVADSAGDFDEVELETRVGRLLASNQSDRPEEDT